MSKFINKIVFTLWAITMSQVAFSDIVEVNVQYADNPNINALGTGTVVGDGIVATAYHVVDNEGTITIFSGNLKEDRKASIIAKDVENDVALLKVDTSGLTPFRLENHYTGYGMAMGYLDDQFHTSKGSYVSVENDSKYIMYFSTIYQGQSGGALIDTTTGGLVGIISAINVDKDSCGPIGGTIIPIKYVEKMIDSVKQKRISFFDSSD